MEERYKSLAAMKPEPWIDHFKKTVGQSSQWSRQPRPVVIDRKAKDSTKANSNDLPLTVVSPLEQYNEMAAAEPPKSPKTAAKASAASLSSGSASSAQQKRKSTSKAGNQRKKINRVKDIFSSSHGR